MSALPRKRTCYHRPNSSDNFAIFAAIRRAPREGVMEFAAMLSNLLRVDGGYCEGAPCQF